MRSAFTSRAQQLMFSGVLENVLSKAVRELPDLDAWKGKLYHCSSLGCVRDLNRSRGLFNDLSNQREAQTATA